MRAGAWVPLRPGLLARTTIFSSYRGVGMASVTEDFNLIDWIRGLRLDASYVYDDQSLAISRVDYANVGTVPVRLEVVPTGGTPVDVTVAVGQSGTVRGGGRLNGFEHPPVVRLTG